MYVFTSSLNKYGYNQAWQLPVDTMDEVSFYIFTSHLDLDYFLLLSSKTKE